MLTHLLTPQLINDIERVSKLMLARLYHITLDNIIERILLETKAIPVVFIYHLTDTISLDLYRIRFHYSITPSINTNSIVDVTFNIDPMIYTVSIDDFVNRNIIPFAVVYYYNNLPYDVFSPDDMMRTAVLFNIRFGSVYRITSYETVSDDSCLLRPPRTPTNPYIAIYIGRKKGLCRWLLISLEHVADFIPQRFDNVINIKINATNLPKYKELTPFIPQPTLYTVTPPEVPDKFPVLFNKLRLEGVQQYTLALTRTIRECDEYECIAKEKVYKIDLSLSSIESLLEDLHYAMQNLDEYEIKEDSDGDDE